MQTAGLRKAAKSRFGGGANLLLLRRSETAPMNGHRSGFNLQRFLKAKIRHRFFYSIQSGLLHRVKCKQLIRSVASQLLPAVAPPDFGLDVGVQEIAKF